MDKDNSNGPMEENMKASMQKIKNMDLVNSNGLMEENIEDNGKTENK